MFGLLVDCNESQPSDVNHPRKECGHGHETHFYSAPQCSHCKRCTSYGNSIRPSVCLSHACIVSKRRHV